MSHSKPANKIHYGTLDGLRGVAALAVGLLHASQTFAIGYIPHHASLAVDFFFMLSGFVICFAYDSSLIAGMSFVGFVNRRLARLYPMILMAIALGACSLLVQFHSDPDSIRNTALLALGTLIFLPLGLGTSPDAYPINPPLWSLFFEIFANLAYAALAAWSVNRQKLTVIGAVLLLALWLRLVFRWHTLECVGFFDLHSFLWGFVRVLIPFILGIVICRAGWTLREVARSDAYGAVALVCILLFPHFVDIPEYDIVSVLVLFPMLIIIGRSASSGILPAAFWSWMGRISYPLYLVHWPVIKLSAYAFRRYQPGVISGWAEALIALTLSIALSYLILIYIDEPVRRKWGAILKRWSATPQPSTAANSSANRTG